MGGGAESVGVEAVTQVRRPVTSLGAADFDACPVWEFVEQPDEHEDETWVTPVHPIPVDDLSGRIVGTLAMLADGSVIRAVLANVDLQHSTRHAEFMTISVEKNGQWFFLARYHDHNFDVSGPDALARFLDRKVDQVFPISYEISRVVSGGMVSAVRGCIPAKPLESLSDSERMKLIFQ